MNETNRVYKNSTELMNLAGLPFFMADVVDACLYGRLNLFLQGDTGSGKTQLARDVMSYFPDKSMFVLGRNDMDTRELFQQINPEFFKALKEGTLEKGVNPKELTSKINTSLFVVDELPNCVPAVRAQLFNLFDGFMEINGQTYPLGKGYSVGIATGNIGQKFTESNNDLGRALKDRMHVTIDTDYFKPTAWDTFNILSSNTNPRVDFGVEQNGDLEKIILKTHQAIASEEIPFEKLILVNYLIHGLDYVNLDGRETTKTKMKDAWPNAITNHGDGSDEALILPVSPRAAKSILRLSQAFDCIAKEKGASDVKVRENYGNDKYSAIDAVTQSTRTQYDMQLENISAGLKMVSKGSKSQNVFDSFTGRWKFMRDFFDKAVEQQKTGK